MSFPTNVFSPADLTTRVARRRGLALHASLVAACVHLGLSAGAPQASVAFVGAVLLGVPLLRIFGRDPHSAGGSRRAVFASGAIALFGAPFAIALLDPGSGLAAWPWRSVAIGALCFASLGAQAAFLATRLVDPRSPAVSGSERERAASSASPPSADTLVHDARTTLLFGAFVFSILVADAITNGLLRSWSAARIVAAALSLGTGGAILVLSFTGWLTRALRAREPLSASAVADRRAARDPRDLERAVAELAPPIERVEALARTLVHARDEQASEQTHAVALVRDLVPAQREAGGRVEELSSRIEAALQSTGVVQSGDEGLERELASFAGEIEAAARGLAVARRAAELRDDTIGQLTSVSKQTAAGVAALANAVRAIDGEAGSIAGLSRVVVERAEIGRAKVRETTAGIQAIREATQAAEAVIRGLAARTQEIGGILDVIDDVGDQTSLLALNAAIIAAQAGEQGRAFSVVADEIRDLADRVLVSTKEIAALIRAVQAESEHAIGAIETGSASVLRGVALSLESGHTLDQITEASREAGVRIEAVVGSVKEQARSLEKIVELSTRMETTTHDLSTECGASDRELGGAVAAIDRLRAGAAPVGAQARRRSLGLAGLETELAHARELTRAVASHLDLETRSVAELGRAVGSAGERVRGSAAVGDELAAVERALRCQLDFLRAQCACTDDSAARTSHAARTPGESS